MNIAPLSEVYTAYKHLVQVSMLKTCWQIFSSHSTCSMSSMLSISWGSVLASTVTSQKFLRKKPNIIRLATSLIRFRFERFLCCFKTVRSSTFGLVQRVREGGSCGLRKLQHHVILLFRERDFPYRAALIL